MQSVILLVQLLMQFPSLVKRLVIAYYMKQRKSQNLILVSMNVKAVIRLSDTPLGMVLKNVNLNY